VQARLDQIARLVNRAGRHAVNAAASRFLAEELEPAWQVISEAIQRRCTLAGLRPERRLPLAERCLAPLDFGLHQALLTRDDKLVFFDFAGAGWEEPAWVAACCFCQPKLSPSLDYWDAFTRNLARALGQSSEMAIRARILLPACRFQKLCQEIEALIVGRRFTAKRLKIASQRLKKIAGPQWWR
jgi:hypothetical protein